MSTKRLSAVIQIGGAVNSTLGSALGKTTKDLGKVGEAIKDIARQQDKVKAYDFARTGLRTAIQDYSKARLKVDELGSAIKAVGRPTEQMRLEMGQAVAAMHKAESAMDRQRTKLHTLRSELQGAGVDTKHLASEQARLGASMAKMQAGRRFSENLSARRTRNDEMVGALTPAALGMFATTASLAIPLREAMKSETEMAQIRKTVGGTVEELRQLADESERMSLTRPVTREEVREIYALAGQANVAKEKMGEFTKNSIDMSLSFNMARDAAAEMFLSWQAGMRLSDKQAVLLGDTINKLGNDFQGKVSEVQIGEFLQREGATLAANGLNAGQSAALAAAMIAPGNEPERAATAAKHLTSALTKGFASTRRQRDAYAILGFSPEQIAKDMQCDAEGTIIKVLEKIRSIPKHQQAAVQTMLFGDEGRGVVSSVLNNLDSLRRAFSMVKDANSVSGAMAREAALQADTTEGKFAIFLNTVVAISNAVGNSLKPAFGQMLGAINPVLGSVVEFVQKNRGLVSVLVGVGATALIATTAVVGLGYGFLLARGGVLGFLEASKVLIGEQAMAGIASKATGLIPLIGRALPTALGAARVAIVGLQASIVGIEASIPGVGWALLAIGAIATVVVANWDKIGPVVGRAWQVATYWTNQAWQAIQPTVGQITGVIQSKWAQVTSWFNSNLPMIKTVAQNIWNGLKTIFSWTPLGTVIKNFKPAIDFMMSSLSKLGVVGQQIKWIFDGKGTMPKPGDAFKATKTSVPGSAVANMPTKPPGKPGAPNNVIKLPVPANRQPGSTTVNRHYVDQSKVTVHVAAAPGMNEDALARKVAAQVQAMQAKKARGALHD